MRNRLFIGNDPGGVQDFNGLSVVERWGQYETPEPHYDEEGRWCEYDARWTFKEWRLQHLERTVGEPYPSIVERILKITADSKLKDAEVVVDATGIGRPIVDFMRKAGIRRLRPVMITGGDTVTEDTWDGMRVLRVPKRDLVGCLQVHLQNKTLKIPDSIPYKKELIEEMQNFKVKLAEDTGKATFEHWRSGDHDDLVLALALPLWYGDRPARPAFRCAMLPI